MENIIAILPTVSYVLFALAAIIVVCAIVAILKKVFKLGIILVVIALIITIGGYGLNILPQQIGVRVEEGTLIIDAGFAQHNIELVDIVEIRVAPAGTGMVSVEIDRKQGGEIITTTQTMPQILYEQAREALKPVLEKGNLQIEIIENF